MCALEKTAREGRERERQKGVCGGRQRENDIFENNNQNRTKHCLLRLEIKDSGEKHWLTGL